MATDDLDAGNRDENGDAEPERRKRFALSSAASRGLEPGGFRDLGITPLARQLGLAPEQTNGHWCSRCEGIWFGYTLEAQCPVCGNRKG